MLHKSPSGIETQGPYQPSQPAPTGPTILDAWVAPQRTGVSTGVSFRF